MCVRSVVLSEVSCCRDSRQDRRRGWITKARKAETTILMLPGVSWFRRRRVVVIQGKTAAEHDSRKRERRKRRSRMENLVVIPASQYNSLHNQGRCIEVEKKPGVEMGGLQIGLELSEVDVLECVDGLDLHDDLPLD